MRVRALILSTTMAVRSAALAAWPEQEEDGKPVARIIVYEAVGTR